MICTRLRKGEVVDLREFARSLGIKELLVSLKEQSESEALAQDDRESIRFYQPVSFFDAIDDREVLDLIAIAG